ncbi:hypothetical protein CP973_33930 [Streptomyces albofaciens JCM 4342]|uniref:hypothetical protein n=1 Tax=Streptomyces albofaciens TaxID=66866 RepID=UPI00123ABD59|nr:hypothetical protein [Streptomyces albofaciens]KAA6214135.1 hypothetical protein CP973_33930 [Streptomyces albofaciens JCM 4342]
MISFMKTQKVTDRPVVATCTLGASLLGTGLSGFGRLSGFEVSRAASSAFLPEAKRDERPTQVPAVAAVAPAANAHAFAGAATNGAESRKQYQTQQDTWAHRGHEPWRDPA